MSNLIIRMLNEAQVKVGPTGFNYQKHWKFSKDTKIHKSLYKHINQAVKSLLHLPIVSLSQLKQQLRNDDYLRQSVLKSSTSGYKGKVLITANVILSRPIIPNNNNTHSFVTIYKIRFSPELFILFQNNTWLELFQQILLNEHLYSQICSVIEEQ